jgi:hypothetical protein
MAFPPYLTTTIWPRKASAADAVVKADVTKASSSLAWRAQPAGLAGDCLLLEVMENDETAITVIDQARQEISKVNLHVACLE